jgi:cell volume regulation protein A
MQISMFLVLGLLVFPSRLPAIIGPALLLSAFLMLAARPAAVYLSLWRSPFTVAQRTLVAWTGLRGAVPIVLATFPFLAGYRNSDQIFNIVFFIVLTSVLLEGKSLMLLARWLKVDEPLVARPRYPLEFDRTPDMQSETREIDIPPDADAVGKMISELGLPPEILILLIRRGYAFVVPRGQTMIKAFDTLMLLAQRSELHKVQELLLAGGEMLRDRHNRHPDDGPSQNPGPNI